MKRSWRVDGVSGLDGKPRSQVIEAESDKEAGRIAVDTYAIVPQRVLPASPGAQFAPPSPPLPPIGNALVWVSIVGLAVAGAISIISAVLNALDALSPPTAASSLSWSRCLDRLAAGVCMLGLSAVVYLLTRLRSRLDSGA
jgi:hypothetical protein